MDGNLNDASHADAPDQSGAGLFDAADPLAATPEPAAVEPDAPAPGRHASAGAGRVPPPHLASLLAARGVPESLLDGVNPDTAWARFVQLGADNVLPLAHLAPDAIETLEELGYTGQVRGEIRAAKDGPVIRFFAFRLPERPVADGDTGQQAAAMLDRRLERLEDAITRLAEAQASAPARGAGGLANLDVSTLRELLALLPAIRRGGAVVRDLLAMFAQDDAEPPATGEDQAQVLTALFGGLRGLLDSELGQLLLDKLGGRSRLRVMPGAADAG
jgi:hypothetical protein